MKKVLLAVFLFMLAQFAAPVAAWDDCPFGLENDPYPGECSRYTDTNDDGICDHSQSEPQTNKTEESGEASISDVGGENTEVEVEEEVSQSGSSRNRSYNIAVPFFSTLVLYLSSWFLTKTAIAKKHVFFSLPLFKMVWNSVLVLSAVPSVVFGFYLALRYSWKWLGTSQINFLFLHVEGSIVFGTLSILHLILRVQQYLAPAKLLRVKTSK